MIVVPYEDEQGRNTAMQVPDGLPRDLWHQGIPIGPPDLSSLGLKEETTTRLHNELFNRGIIRKSDARLHRTEVHAALMSALAVDAERIIAIYERDANA